MPGYVMTGWVDLERHNTDFLDPLLNVRTPPSDYGDASVSDDF